MSAAQVEVAKLIIQESERQDYPDPLLALYIAYAESGLNPKAKNANSSASGTFQFIRSTWQRNCEGSVFDTVNNVRCGIKLLKEPGGHNHWAASLHYWLKPYTAASIAYSKIVHGF